MKVILSIKPLFAKKIFDGTKKFEFRRVIFKDVVTTVIVYASSPLQMVIGEFEIEAILKEDLNSLWEKTQDHAGIEKDYFSAYFINKKQGFAIKIKNAIKYKVALCLKEEYNLFPPQSFLYIK